MIKRRPSVIPLALLSLTTLALVENRADVKEIVRAFEERDLVSIQGLRPQLIEKLPLEGRNRVAFAAAKSLGIEDYLQAIGNPDAQTYFTKPSGTDSIQESECRKQLGINWSAAELLQYLAEHRLINDARIIPYLIRGLDHPAKSWVAQECYYALEHLTRHHSGNVYWGRLIKDDKRHAAIMGWWKHWWEENKDRHPLFDTEIETRARNEVVRLAKNIEEHMKPKYPELEMFEVPRELPLRWEQTLFFIEYNPRGCALPPGIFKSVMREQLPWLVVLGRFRSKDLPEERQADETYDLPPELQPHRKVCYSKEIDGTDLVVEVLAASRNPQLMNELADIGEGS